MLRTEAALAGLFLATWLAAIAYSTGLLAQHYTLRFDLYGLYVFAAAFGWVVGNLYTLRLRSLDPRLQRRFLGLYLVVPAGTVALVRALTAVEWRAAAPLAGLYALCVYAIFWFVPWTVRKRTLR
jgi:hypothetical protein